MLDEGLDDRELLRLATEGSREAVAQIARRYIGFVYAGALRQVRDPHLAEDVTQAVFVILAQKIHRIKPGTLLHAWLFSTTRFAVKNATKLRDRRLFHERRAAAMREREIQSNESSASHAITSQLDDALAQLRAMDRSAVLLSYMAGKSWREVADALGTTEEAARKRVSRAVAQLRGIFARRGVATTGAALVAAMNASAQASVSPALLASVTTAVTSSGCTAAASSLIAKGAIHMMTWAHVKAAAVGAIVVLTVLGGAGAMVMHQNTGKPAAGAGTAQPPAGLVPVEIKYGAFTGTLESGITVELLAVSKRDGKDRAWWAPDGTPTSHKFNDSTSQDDPPHSHQVVVHVTGGGAKDYSTMLVLPDVGGWSAQPASQGGAEIEGMQIVTFRARDGAETMDLTVKVAAGEWETRSRKAETDGITITDVPDGGAVAWGQSIDDGGRTAVTVSDTLKGAQRRIVAVDQNGNEHEPSERSMGAGGGLNLSAVKFDLPLDQVAEMRFQSRAYDQGVVFKNVSLVGGKKTDARVEVVRER